MITKWKSIETEKLDEFLAQSGWDADMEYDAAGNVTKLVLKKGPQAIAITGSYGGLTVSSKS